MEGEAASDSWQIVSVAAVSSVVAASYAAGVSVAGFFYFSWPH